MTAASHSASVMACFHPAMIRAHSRAWALSAMPGKYRRSMQITCDRCGTETAAIRAAYEQSGELSAAVELVRLLPIGRGDGRRLAIIVGRDVSTARRSLCQTGVARLFEDGRVIPTSAAASSPTPNRAAAFLRGQR